MAWRFAWVNGTYLPPLRLVGRTHGHVMDGRKQKEVITPLPWVFKWVEEHSIKRPWETTCLVIIWDGRRFGSRLGTVLSIYRYEGQ